MTRSRYCAAAVGALPQRTAWAAAIAMLVIGSPACEDPIYVERGAIRVTVATTGVDTDGDGYRVHVVLGPIRAIGINETITLTGIRPGVYTLQLDGMAANCALQGDGPGPIEVVAGRTTNVTLAVTCTATTGSVQVTIMTAGVDFVGGYVVTVSRGRRDGGSWLGTQFPVSSNGATWITRVPVGQQFLTLREVPPNCDERDGFRRDVSVASSDSMEVVFDLVCVPATPLVYVKPSADGTANIAIASSNGTGEKLLTMHPAWDGDPAWSPDRSRIAFATDRDGNREIYMMDADGSQPIRLTNDPARDHSPDWSPDGTRIVFVRDHATDVNGGSLWVMSADGTDPVRLTRPELANDAFDTDPAWSPQGLKIAFTRFERGVQPAIYWMNADGSGVARLSGAGYTERNPAWSPDGFRLAFARSFCAFGSYGCYDTIVVVDVDGGDRPLGNIPGTEPAWSADGRHIAYAALACDTFFSECNAGEIRVIRADGSSDFGLGIAGSGPAWR